MANTVPNGVYLKSDGETYQDANGNPVDKKVVAEFQRLQAETQAQREQEEAWLQQQNPNLASVLAPLLRATAAPQAAPSPAREAAREPDTASKKGTDTK